MDPIGSFCEAASLKLSVQFVCYRASFNTDTLNLSVQHDICCVTFSMTEAMKNDTLHVIKRYGHCIDRLILRDQENNQPLNIISHETDNAIFLQSLKYCIKLKYVEIIGVVIDISNTTLLKQNVNLLRLQNCTIQIQGGMKSLSELFASINRLELQAVKYTNSTGNINGGYMDVDMTETAIGTLSISRDPQLITENLRKYVFLVKTSLQQQDCGYYLYNSRSMNDFVFKPVTEEMYTAERAQQRCLTINISCKSVDTIESIHGIVTVKLKLI